jgi:hypothetical protein
MNRIKLFEEFVSEKIITINWLDDESSLVFSDVGPIRVDYDGDFKYRNKVFSTAENQGPEDLIQDLSAAFKGDKFVYEKLSVVGGLAKEILNAILPATMFPKGDIDSQKNHKKMVDDLIKTLNNFYEKYDIDKKIII